MIVIVNHSHQITIHIILKYLYKWPQINPLYSLELELFYVMTLCNLNYNKVSKTSVLILRKCLFRKINIFLNQMFTLMLPKHRTSSLASDQIKLVRFISMVF